MQDVIDRILGINQVKQVDRTKHIVIPRIHSGSGSGWFCIDVILLAEQVEQVDLALMDHSVRTRITDQLADTDFIRNDLADIACIGDSGERNTQRHTLVDAALVHEIVGARHLDHQTIGTDRAHAGHSTLVERHVVVTEPANALDIPYKVDDEACSLGSSWVRGKIAAPREKRPLLRTNLYRCGICQQVCPFNHKLKPRESFPFELEGDEDWPELTRILLADEAEMLRLMGPTVMKKSKPEWLRCNAAVAAGNAGDAAAVPALIETLGNADAPTRAACAWALGKLGGEQAILALKGLVSTETEAAVKQEADAALAGLA